MKITCAKKDDLMRAKYDYDSLTDRYRAKVNEGEDKYKFATDEAAAFIENAVRDQLGSTSIMDLSIRVDTDWDYANRSDFRTWKVRVEAHDRDKFDDGVALSWHWEAKLDREGNTIKDSGSWSGLKAVTPEQIEDLEESIRLMKALNNMDWKSILSEAIPHSKDYIDQEAQNMLYDRKKNRPDFESQILDAEIDEAIQSGEWIKLNGRPNTDYYREARYGRWWCKIDSMTDKFVKCHIARELENGSIDPSRATDERIGKAKLFSFIAKPIETKAF